MAYCVHNAQKLHNYQRNEVFIGKNLILTQDDSEGNCNSAFIWRIIKEHILPQFNSMALNMEYPVLIGHQENVLHQKFA
ncbi:hypothetical protein D3Z38_13780 [Clostridiales bacterium]|nr:hypothetical protein [Clostridiales bacterium]